MIDDLIVYFKNSYGKRREIGKVSSEKEAFKVIHQFLDDHHFKSYYTRSWINPEDNTEKYYDVGSHTEFFICVKEGGWNNKS